MTVQTAGGNIVVGPGDFTRTDRGINWAIKCREIDGAQIVVVLVMQADGSWSVESQLDGAFDLKAQAEGFDVLTWFKTVILPALNKWLATKFPALAPGEVPPVSGVGSGPLFTQADALIQGIKITVNADGTLIAG